tara:strand:- start:903 stop:1940 length:1038 start_codon:yes stop_codon:yes gene_type:complete
MKNKINYNTQLDFDDVLINPKLSKVSLTRKDVDVYVDNALPIAISYMMSTGTYNVAKLMNEHNVYTFLHKEYTYDEHISNLTKIKKRNLLGITSGVQPWDLKKTSKVLEKFPDIGIIHISIANVYANLEGIIKTIKFYKNAFLDCKVSAGVIANEQLIEPLIEAGADLISTGVGTGAACKTRTEVGVGVPQLSTLVRCSPIIHKMGAKVIADGGCKTSGDVAKAIGAGADIVIISSMVNHCKECDNIVEINKKQYVNIWGLGSKKQYQLTNPTQHEYRPNEGRELLVPVSGSMVDVIEQIKGGLRSACTYVGAKNLKEFYKNTEFIKVNSIINNSMINYEKVKNG